MCPWTEGMLYKARARFKQLMAVLGKVNSPAKFKMTREGEVLLLHVICYLFTPLQTPEEDSSTPGDKRCRNKG